MTREADSDGAAIRSNVPEMTVNELALSLKRTLEETYSHVRVRGELSRVTIPRSGHLYSDLKDENACINIVCWKGTLGRLAVRPEEGLEVICTGRVSSYPGRSNYQLIIESMELAGQGALLKMLEDRRKKLAAEGLFDPARKKKLPYLPEVIGVVTSPTGAVIRDIMHRLNDRFPRRVLLWPVLVQGPGAAEQVAAAIRGFDALPPSSSFPAGRETPPSLPPPAGRGEVKVGGGGVVPRPDLIIVARGGGSLEDLMAFNEEIVVRAVADCTIPVISAIGHETDTTLIDHAADVRAPTPTGAAEMAVPVRAELLAWAADQKRRLITALSRLIGERRTRVQAVSARLGDPARLLEMKTQKLDHLAHKLGTAFERGLSRKSARTAELGAKLRHPRDRIAAAGRVLDIRGAALMSAGGRLLDKRTQTLAGLGRMLESLSFKGVLARGFVVVRDEKGRALTGADQTKPGQAVSLQFRDDRQVDAVIGGKPAQGKLF